MGISHWQTGAGLTAVGRRGVVGVSGKVRVLGPKTAGTETQQNRKEVLGGGEKQERPDCRNVVWLSKLFGV